MFNNQWIEIFKVGVQVDSEGRTHQITSEFLEQAARNYEPPLHEAPAVIGHPREDGPAYAWAKALRVNNGVLEAQFSDINPAFEEMVRTGLFKKRSASFYVDPSTAPGGRVPYLRHVGFLGAQPPAVKGLRDIKFNEGDSITFESQANFSEVQTMDEKEQNSLVTKIVEGVKSLFPKKDGEPAQASFTEADLKRMITEGVTAQTASFTEKITALETENKSLRTIVEQQGSNATRTDLTNYVEKLGIAKLPESLRPGLVDFMEAISGNDKKISVVSFAEENGNKVEKKTEYSPLSYFKNFLENLGPFIQFGESFSSLRAIGAAAGGADPKEVNDLLEKTDLPPTQGGK